MYRVFFSFVFIGFLCVCGQNIQSPCPDYFDYRSDGTGVHGIINLQPFGNVPALMVRANFTIAARLPSTYAGNIQPIGSEMHLLQEFNRGVPIQYRVNFPVTAPLPKLVALTANDNILCYGDGDHPDQAQYVTTISLQHMLFFKTGNGDIYNLYPQENPTPEIAYVNQPPQTQMNTTPQPTPAPEIIYVNQPPQTQNNLDPIFSIFNINNKPWNHNGDYSKKTTEAPRLTTMRQENRITTERPLSSESPPRRPYRPRPTAVGSGGSNNFVQCGISGKNEPVALVFQGHNYERGEWPWLVAIYKQKYSSLTYICAGTLVSDRHVVSAAHCMHRKSSYTSMKNLVVKAGVYNLDDWGDDITVTRTLTGASIHESYNSSTLANDILVLTLDKKIPLNTYIKPACLWSGNTDLNRIVGSSGVVAGWGANEMGPGGKGEPRMVRMPIVSTATCRASKPEFHRLTSGKTICAGDQSGSGPCLGDSGGGLYLHDNGRWKLRGVVSLSLWSENGDNTCNLHDYVVFTDTAQYLPWIGRVMSNNV